MMATSLKALQPKQHGLPVTGTGVDFCLLSNARFHLSRTGGQDRQ